MALRVQMSEISTFEVSTVCRRSIIVHPYDEGLDELAADRVWHVHCTPKQAPACRDPFKTTSRSVQGVEVGQFELSHDDTGFRNQHRVGTRTLGIHDTAPHSGSEPLTVQYPESETLT
jgi:hypothetical protein